MGDHISFELLKEFHSLADALREVERLRLSNDAFRHLVLDVQSADADGVRTLEDLAKYLETCRADRDSTPTVRWAARRIITERGPESEHQYAVMHLAIHGIWTDRAYCADEEEAFHLVELLNIAERTRA